MTLRWTATFLAILALVCKSTASEEETQIFGLRPEWYDHEDECYSLMGNRDLYEVVSSVCNDCQNIYRNSNIKQNCRANCFLNSDFKECLNALRLSYHNRFYRLLIHILRVGASHKTREAEEISQ